jgi:hypothetical protein
MSLLTLRQTTTALIICVFGAAGVVFAQDDVESLLDIDNVDIVDVDDVNTAGNVDGADNPPKSGKSKSHKSEKKAAKAAGGDEAGFSEAGGNDTPKAPKSSKSGKSSKPKAGKSDKHAAAEPAGTTLKYNGLVAAGVDFNRKVNRKEGNATESKRVAKGELELSAQPVKKVRAEIGIEYNINGRTMIADSLRVNKLVHIIDPMEGLAALTDVELELIKGLPLGPFVAVDKLYAQYNIVDNGVVRVGIMKKAFGLEERAGLDERCFLKRSVINDGLETLGFLDHDLTVAYRHDLLNDALRLTGAFSWSVADSSAYLQNYSAHYRPAKNMEVLLAGIIRHYSAKDTLVLESKNIKRLPATLTTYAASLSFKYDAAICVSEAEVTFGTNPNTLLTQNRAAALFGARLQEQFPIDVNTKILRRVTPVVEAAAYTADMDSDLSETQIKAGVTLGFAKNSAFQFRNNVGTIIRTENKKSTVKRFRFDSEVVVIF